MSDADPGQAIQYVVVQTGIEDADHITTDGDQLVGINPPVAAGPYDTHENAREKKQQLESDNAFNNFAVFDIPADTGATTEDQPA